MKTESKDWKKLLRLYREWVVLFLSMHLLYDIHPKLDLPEKWVFDGYHRTDFKRKLACCSGLLRGRAWRSQL